MNTHIPKTFIKNSKLVFFCNKFIKKTKTIYEMHLKNALCFVCIIEQSFFFSFLIIHVEINRTFKAATLAVHAQGISTTTDRS